MNLFLKYVSLKNSFLGPNKLSALDLLADIGLVNYFGKWTDLTHVTVQPLVISKGDTKLALFGLSHIRDERLSRLFKGGEVNIKLNYQQKCLLLIK